MAADMRRPDSSSGLLCLDVFTTLYLVAEINNATRYITETKGAELCKAGLSFHNLRNVLFDMSIMNGLEGNKEDFKYLTHCYC